MLAFLLVLGCNDVGRAASRSLGPEAILGVYPPDGAWRLQGDVPVRVLLGDAGRRDTPTAEVTVAGETVTLACKRGRPVLATCGPIPALDWIDGDVKLHVHGDDGEITTTGTTRTPPASPAWDLLDGTRVERFGGDDLAADVLGEVLRGHLLAAWVAEEARIVGGPVVPAYSGEGFQTQPPGLGFVLDATADGGQLVGSAHVVWLSVEIEGSAVLAPLLDVRLTGTMRPDGDLVRLDDLILEANAPALAIELLAEPFEEADTIQEAVELDVDRDGDGDFDSASLKLTGAPAPAKLSAWIPL
jgi:hypothetical protein